MLAELTKLAEQNEARAQAERLTAWNLLNARDLSTPLPPIPWLCEPMRIAPGAVTLVAGYGYSRKTMALQSMALAVAAGRPLWGLWSVRQGRAVHLDYEQGRRLTQERYQRLARGMGFELGDLDKSALTVASMPRVYLETQPAIDSLMPIVDGAAFVLIDSLRAAFPHADENSSEVRSYIDALNHVSERTGATIVVIHHARKPTQQQAGTATHAIRGSSALFDACQSVFVFAGAKDTPTTVHHEKDRIAGSTLEDFGIMSEDIQGPTGARWGLAVRHLEGEQVDASTELRARAKRDVNVERVATQIVTILAEREGPFDGARREIKALVHAKTETFDEAWRKLIDAGVLANVGTPRHPLWTVCAS